MKSQSIIPTVNAEFLKTHIDFTNVRPDTTQQEIVEFCDTAIVYRVQTIYVPQVFIELAVAKLKSHGIEVGTTAGFPYGNIPFEVKKAGIIYAVRCGVHWVDVCLNLSPVKSGDWSEVEREIERLMQTTKKHHVGLKLIIESPYLSEDELVQLTRLANGHSVNYLKTASGVGTQVSERDMNIIKPLLTHTRLKAAGGISSLSQALHFFSLGADCIGSSKGFQILTEATINC